MPAHKKSASEALRELRAQARSHWATSKDIQTFFSHKTITAAVFRQALESHFNLILTYVPCNTECPLV